MRRPAALLVLLAGLACLAPAGAGEPGVERVRVLGPRGRPLPGATLHRAAGVHAGRVVFEAGRPALATSDLQGWLTLPAADAEAEARRLVVWAPGTAPALLGRSGAVRTLRLLGARESAGIVQLGPGSAARERSILALPADPDADLLQRTRTDERGAYRFATLHAGDWDIVLLHADGRAQRIGRVRAGEDLAAVALRSDTGLRGRLLDADGTGSVPASGVELAFVPAGVRAGETVRVTTAGDGTFFAAGLAPGVHEVRSADPAWAFDPWPPHVQVERRRVRQLPTWFAVRLQAVQGRVVDLEGRPVSGATLHMVPDPRQEPLPGSRARPLEAVRSAADGAFRFPGVPPGEGYRLAVEAPGRAPWTSNAFAVDRGRSTALDPVRLSPGWRVRVRVADLDGGALPHVEVRARAVSRPVAGDAGPWQAGMRRGRTDATGETLLEDLPLDDVFLEARAPGWLPGVVRVPYPRVSDTRRAEILLERAPRLAGRVIRSEGAPPPPYRVRALPRDGSLAVEAESDPQGRFLLTDLTATATDLHVLGTVGGPGAPLAVVEGVMPGLEEDLEIPLPLSRKLAGRVQGIDPGRGPVEVIVEMPLHHPFLERVAWREAARVPVEAAGVSGIFRVEGLPPGPYAVRALQGARDSGTHALLLDEQDVEDLELLLPEGAHVAGTVLDEEGMPLLGARVRLVRWHAAQAAALGPQGRSEHFTDERGDFLAEDLAPGVWHVQATASGRAPQSLTVRLGDGEVRVLKEMLLDAGGTLAGRVADADDRGLEAVPVELLRLGGEVSIRQVETDGEGRFRAALLEPGTWRVRVAAEGLAAGPWREGLAEVRSGQMTEVRFSAEDDGAVGGRVHLEGRPVAGAVVELGYDPPGAAPLRRYRTRTDVEGRFRVEGLQAGAYELQVQNGAWRTREAIDLLAGDRLELEIEAFAARLRGRVVTREGRPVAGALVVAHPDWPTHRNEDEPPAYAEGRSGPGGDFVLRGLPAGAYRLDVRARGQPPGVFAGAEADMPGADFAVEVVLGRGGELALRVIDPAERGVTGALVRLEDENGRVLGDESWVTGAAGRLRIEGVPPGRMKVRVHARGLGTPEAVTVRLDEGARRDLVVRLAPGGSLQLVVTGDAGDPLARTRVDLRRAGSGEVLERRRPLSPLRLADPWGWVPRTGIVTLDDLAAGEYVARIEAGRGYEPLEVPVRIEAGRRARVEVRLRAR